ncbi:hypothetical protein OROMI_012582 [Orobanche minor]
MKGERSSTKPETAVIEEWNGSASSKLTKTATFTVSGATVRRSALRFNHFSRRVLDAFVPEGFPGSVTPDYVSFQIWDSLQGLSTYVRTMLSTQALLSAIGVGEKSATVIGATFQWFLRDLTGMLGGVLFTFYQGADLDSNAKMWRLVADLMNDLLDCVLWMTSWKASREENVGKRVRLGVRISSLTSDEVSYYNKGMYILLARKSVVNVIVHRDSTAADILQAFMHALVSAKLDDKSKSIHLEGQSWMDKNIKTFFFS